jgi:hypothetical protein
VVAAGAVGFATLTLGLIVLANRQDVVNAVLAGRPRLGRLGNAPRRALGVLLVFAGAVLGPGSILVLVLIGLGRSAP